MTNYPTSPLPVALSCPAWPRRGAHLCLSSLLAVAVLSGCQPPDSAVEPQASAKPAATRVPLTPEQESALALLAGLATEPIPASALPEGITIDKVWQEPVAAQSARFQAVGKISFDVRTARSEQDTRLVYTVYPTVADAVARFETIGEPPADRVGIKSRAPLAVAVPDVPTWGEISNEAYPAKENDAEGKPVEKALVRVSTAARIGRVLVVTQTMTWTTEPDPRALSNAIDLLKVAVERAKALKDPGPGGSDASAASAATTDSAVVPEQAPQPSPAGSAVGATHPSVTPDPR